MLRVLVRLAVPQRRSMLSSISHNRGASSCNLSRKPGLCCRANRLLSANVFAFREWNNKRSNSTNTKAGPRRDFLEARQISLYELFDGNAWIFDVPEYQRPYSWKAKQIHELLADLQTAYESGQEYFLGAIVTTRQGDAAGEPYWVIDGQQRLTTLVMLLGYLRAWAASQPGMSSLAERVEHMLHIPADPLNPGATARYRLLLRSSEQQFFTDNFIQSYLPVRYHLSTQLDGPANAAGDYHEAAHTMTLRRQQPSSSSSSSGSNSPTAAVNGVGQQQQQQGVRSIPLCNEAWWRLYCAGDVMACYLASALQGGLNLQEFMHHVLKNCMVVLMTARDESTSFKIFSTLNGRGVDLAVVDKLKPELMQGLPVHLRQSYADRWSALESALGRPSFHALFDHYITIEQAATAAQGGSSSSSSSSSPAAPSHISWGHTSNEPADAASSSTGSTGSTAAFIPPGSTLISHMASHHSAAGSGGHLSLPSALHRPDVLRHLSGHANVEGVLSMVLEYGQRLLQIRANDWSSLEAEGGTAPAIAAELSEAAFFINLLADDAWQPWTLEFFYQSADDAKRAAFLKGAELLTLYCELKQDEGFKQERWLSVGSQLLQRPFYSDQVLAALALAPDEADEFIKLLDARDLAATADEGLLAHLLLRADSINTRATHWRRLKVEKIMPTHPPEGSQWRKQKLLLPALSEADMAAAGSSSSQPGYGLFNPVRGRASGSGSSGSSRGSSAGGGSSNRSSSRSSRGRTTTSSSSSSAGSAAAAVAVPAIGPSVSEAESAGSSMDGRSPQSAAPPAAAAAAGTNGSSSSSSSNVPPGMREMRYWHEITRSHWVNRLGNLVLLQPSGQESAATSHLSADLPAKLSHYAACAADEHFPDFSGGLVCGRYSRDMFSPEECRVRHADIISRLIAVFGLTPLL